MFPKRITIAAMAAVLALVSLKACAPTSSLLTDLPEPMLASVEQPSF